MVDMNRFHPVFRWKLEQVLQDLTKLGWQPIVASGVRSEAEQAEKVKKGYSKTLHSWHVPSTAQMFPVGRNAVQFVSGNAADVVDKRYGWGGPAALATFGFWQDLGRAAKKYGLSWGGDWEKFPDVAHIEMKFAETPPQTTVVV
jgi:hypothetical protein